MEAADVRDRPILDRAANCVALALVEAALAARDDSRCRIAAALASAPGPATVAGVGAAAQAQAVIANGYLIHADLADDAYRVAAHPGLTVVPSALARAEGVGATGTSFVRGVLGGYEMACTLADLLLPDISGRGWRVTAAIAPPAAAAAAALVEGLDAEQATEGLRLALGAVGGPLAVVSPGSDAWQLQPALFAGLGLVSLDAASAGLRSPRGILEAGQGPYALLAGGTLPPFPVAARPRILDVTFKQYPVAMYGQAIFDAIATGAPKAGAAVSMTVSVPPFAAGYGSQSSTATSSVASVAGIALRALGDCRPAFVPPAPEAIAVVADDSLPPLGARVELELSGGGAVRCEGSGDTSTWERADVEAHASRRAGDAATALVATAHRLFDGGSVDDLVAAWTALV